MSSTDPTPGTDTRRGVALHADVVARLPAPIREALHIISFAHASEIADLDVAGVRFLAPGPRGHAVVDQLSRFTELEVLRCHRSERGGDLRWRPASLVTPARVIPSGHRLAGARAACRVPHAVCRDVSHSRTDSALWVRQHKTSDHRKGLSGGHER